MKLNKKCFNSSYNFKSLKLRNKHKLKNIYVYLLKMSIRHVLIMSIYYYKTFIRKFITNLMKHFKEMIKRHSTSVLKDTAN